jgi:hypothetical protein
MNLLHSSVLRSALPVAVLVVFSIGASLRADAAPKDAWPSAAEVIEKALDRAAWEKKQAFRKSMTGEHVHVTERLNKQNAVRSRQELRYKLTMFDGHPFYERVRIDGRPLTADEKRREQERKQRFLEELKRKKGEESYKRPRGSYIEFDKQLIGRYRAEVVGHEMLRGRSAYVVRFEPKEGKLPVRRRIDHALNHSNGKIWVDDKEFGVLRVEFHLIEPVTFWGGLLGRLSQLDGRLETVRNEDGFWLPNELRFTMDGRVLFRSLHQRVSYVWYNFAGPKEQPSGE